MKHLRCFTISSVCWGLFSVLICATTILPGVSRAEDLHAWAADYYRENTACTVASIARVDLSRDTVHVSLHIEPGTASGLLASEPGETSNWFALHCPAETHEAWRDSRESFDVLISAELKSGQTYTLSCADYLRNLKLRYKRANNSVVEKIRSLLQQKLNTGETHAAE